VWDGARVAQAFSNLISNAIQHGKQESPVKVSIYGLPNEVVYTVQNESEVIPPSKLRTFFDPVKRFAIRPVSERTVTKSQNLGLGLYVVKQIVIAHSGDITVTSSEKEGVIFTLRLPRKTPLRRTDD